MCCLMDRKGKGVLCFHNSMKTSVFKNIQICSCITHLKSKYWIKRTTVLEDMFQHAYAILSLTEWQVKS